MASWFDKNYNSGAGKTVTRVFDPLQLLFKHDDLAKSTGLPQETQDALNQTNRDIYKGSLAASPTIAPEVAADLGSLGSPPNPDAYTSGPSGRADYAAALTAYNDKLAGYLNSEDPNVAAAARVAVANAPVRRENYTSGPAGQRGYDEAVARQQGAFAAAAKNPSVPEYLQGDLQRGRPELRPENNPALQDYQGVGQALITGDIAHSIGQREAWDAAGGIGAAGADPRARALASLNNQNQQANQTGADLGIVRDSAMGRGPSAADLLGQKMIDDSVRATSSQAATARGGNIAGALRASMNAGTDMRLQGAQQIAAQRAQEQLAAQTLLTQGNSALGQQRNAATGAAGGLYGQDVGRADAGARALTGAYVANQGLIGMGTNVLGGVAQQNFAQQSAASDRETDATRFYADWLQRQNLGLAGNAVAYSGQNLSRDIASAQMNVQRDAAATNAVGGLLSTYLGGGAGAASAAAPAAKPAYSTASAPLNFA